MANLYFTRTGSNADRSNGGQRVSIDTIRRGLAGQQTHFYDEPPKINPTDNPSSFSPYTHTVVEIDASETCIEFPNPGYYVFLSVHPADCLAFLGLPAQ